MAGKGGAKNFDAAPAPVRVYSRANRLSPGAFMTTKLTQSRAPKIGRVGYEQTFKPAVRKRRLVGDPVEATQEAQLTAAAGAWLKLLREEKGLTQRDIADALELKHYARISQMESGKLHLQPQNFEQYANAVGIEPAAFVRQLLSYYSPEIYEILFEERTTEERAAASPDSGA
jgi:transcriptional regulator with XRE-family HTH domain